MGLVRDVLAGFLIYAEIRALEQQPFFMRTNRNVTADFLTIATKVAVNTWSVTNCFDRAETPWRCGRNCASVKTSQLGMAVAERYTAGNPEGDGSTPLAMVACGGSAFTASSVWRRTGQRAMIVEPRRGDLAILLSIWQAQPWGRGAGLFASGRSATRDR